MSSSQLLIKRSFLVILFLFAFLERVVLDLGSNIELVTVTLVLSSFYIGRRESFWLTFVIMALSDLVIGNTNIFLFTWSGFLIPALFAKSFFSRTNIRSKIFKGTLVGMASTGFFFLWTNFGVWLLTSMYSKDALGLLTSYANALPFLRYHAISTLIFVPLGILLTETVIFLNGKFEFGKKLNNAFILN